MQPKVRFGPTPSSGFATYGSIYFELYVEDIDAAAYREDLLRWHQHLTVSAPEVEFVRDAHTNLFIGWNRADAVTVVEASSDGLAPFAPIASATNQFTLTNSALWDAGSVRFFRVSQTK